MFVVWREQRQRVRVRYHPGTCRGSSSAPTGATMYKRTTPTCGASHHAVGQRAAGLSRQGGACVPGVEEHVFRAIGAQRQIVEQAERSARRARRNSKGATSGASTNFRPAILGSRRKWTTANR